MKHRPPVRKVASELTTEELDLLREVIQHQAPDLGYLLTDKEHELTLDESDRLIQAISADTTFTDERGFAFDDLIGRVNLGPLLR